eukprot:1187977-Prorocentrum_minimum.AAC.9
MVVSASDNPNNKTFTEAFKAFLQTLPFHVLVFPFLAFLGSAIDISLVAPTSGWNSPLLRRIVLLIIMVCVVNFDVGRWDTSHAATLLAFHAADWYVSTRLFAAQYRWEVKASNIRGGGGGGWATGNGSNRLFCIDVRNEGRGDVAAVDDDDYDLVTDLTIS